MAKGDFNRGMNPMLVFYFLSVVLINYNLPKSSKRNLKQFLPAEKNNGALRGDKDAMKAARAAHKEKMDALLATKELDENAALELIKAPRKGQQFAMLKMKSDHAIWQVLNAEQRESYQEIKKHLRKKGHKKGHHIHAASAKVSVWVKKLYYIKNAANAAFFVFDALFFKE